jgi:hypothetical protein
MDWQVITSVPNPWGQVPMTGGGGSVTDRVREYMDRVRAEGAKRDCVSRRHHYVPQPYLRRWSDDGKRVRVLNTGDGWDRTLGLRDVCVKENYFRVTGANDEQHNQVEAMMAVIDSETATLLHRLNQWIPGDDLDYEEFMSLAIVMAFQRNRTPQSRRFLTTMAQWHEHRAGQDHVDLINDDFVDGMFRNVYNAADQISTRQLQLWDDPRGRFITCDQPVQMSTDSPKQPPSMVHSRYLWWPISPHRVLVLDNFPAGVKTVHKIASAREVEDLRAAYIRGAESMIIALKGDTKLPAGKRLARRPQLQVDCQPVDVQAAKCRMRMAWGHGSKTIDNACRPLCAMAEKGRGRKQPRRSTGVW